jgi:hypothetical protein
MTADLSLVFLGQKVSPFFVAWRRNIFNYFFTFLALIKIRGDRERVRLIQIAM